MSADALDTVRAALQSGLASPGDHLIVAVSGGQDSCALLHLLWRLKDELSLTLTVAHFDHGYRGEESAADAQFVQQFAEQLDLPFRLGKGDVSSTAKLLGMSIEQAARHARQRFFQSITEEIIKSSLIPHPSSLPKIALGHTQDDHVETVLLHLLRGCGTDGLRGLTQEGFLIQAQPEVSTIKNQKSKINVVRPLLQLSREQTSQYCHQQNIQFRVDSSNKDWQFHRNRIRQELIPHLAEYYNPAIKQAVARLAVLAGQDAEYLDSQAAHAFEHAMVAADSSSICLDADALEELPEVLRSRVARMAVQHMLGHLLDIDYSFYLWLNTVLEGRQVARRTLPGSPSIEVLVEHHFVTMRRMEAHKSALPVEYSLDPPCTLDLAPFGCQIRFFDPNEQPLRDSARIMHRQELDADSINPPYVVRNWQPGDSIQPLGMEGTRKLQDIFVDRKIPRAVRDQVPIVCDRDGIVWVGGLVVSHRARITPSTKRRLTLELTILA